jgi:putative mRNA 3-end processing factor
MNSLLEATEKGLYCRTGDFFVDPWEPVGRAVITHAHSDHARPGSTGYLTVREGGRLLRERLGPDAMIDTVEYGEAVNHNGVRVSLHPAGHILGSCQVRLEYAGEVVVVSGDYKTAADATCRAFEPIRCHLFVTESTFALPIYRWKQASEIVGDIRAWWRESQERGRTCMLYAYSLGKAQRLLAELDPSIGPILVHGAVDRYLPAYAEAGVSLPPTERATDANGRATRGRAMVIAPPSAVATPWLKKFGPITTAFASGWMQIRGTRRRRALDRGFPLSDHADWQGLLWAIQETTAEEVWVTHGYTSVMVRWLTENGISAKAIATRFEGETESDASASPVVDTDGEQATSREPSDEL